MWSRYRGVESRQQEMIPVASTFIYAVLIAPAFDDVSIGYRPTYVFSSLSGL